MLKKVQGIPFLGTMVITGSSTLKSLAVKFPSLFELNGVSHLIAGLNFAVYTFPLIAVAIIGLIYLDMKSVYQRTR